MKVVTKHGREVDLLDRNKKSDFSSWVCWCHGYEYCGTSAPCSLCVGFQLQSLTLRPPPPGTLTIPPNLPLKSAGPRQPPTLSRPRAPTFTLRPNPSASGKEAQTKAEGTTPHPPTLTPKAPPVRHLTVPPPCKSFPCIYDMLTNRKVFRA